MDPRERDHKKLGKELDLFAFSDVVGKGLPLFTPKGSVIRRELERFIVDEEIKHGYLHVYTPDIAKLELYKKSGHYPHYKDSMYAPIEIDEEQFMLRPMTCPHHFELYLRKPVSYRELPMRIAELAKLYRYEQSGELMGLQRVRTFCLPRARLPSPHGAAGETGENLLRQLLERRASQFVEAKDEAAFYGPKIDIQMKNVNGKEDTAFTVQYDFCMPERFDLAYVGEDGEKHRAFVVHRSSIGAIERIMAFLIEKYAGAFPLWLAPIQALVLPVSEKHNAYAKEVLNELKEVNIRTDVDDANESLGKKIRNAKQEKIPYLLVVGDAEVEAKTISVHSPDHGKQNTASIADFI